MFDLIARVLSGFYALPVVGGSYGIAIILLTIAVMIVLMPLTLRATRSTIKMQMVQPELQRIQKEFKADREQMNAELMTLYQEQGINPVGGCVPVLAQLPVFLVLFQVIRGLTRRVGESPFFSVANAARTRTGLTELDPEQFNPRYLDSDSQMYIDLIKENPPEMGFLFGLFDLGKQANDVLANSIIDGIPYLVLLVFVVFTSYYQQRQISARREDNGEPLSAMMQQQQTLLKFLPLMSGFWSFFFPVGLVLYWATSNVFRIGQQAYITKAIYDKKDQIEADLKTKADLRKTTKKKPSLGQRMLEEKRAQESGADSGSDEAESGTESGSNGSRSGGKGSGSKGSNGKGSGSKGSGGKNGTSGGNDRVSARRQAEQARRAKHKAKAAAKKKAEQSAGSSRTTPKGTKPGTHNQASKKRKR